jgi:PilZ domain
VPATDRRIMPRRRVRMPLRFRVLAGEPACHPIEAGRPLAGELAQVLTGESLNLSERGVYFLTDFPLDVGAQLELFLPVACEPAAGCASELRCTARVVHREACPDTQIFRGIHVGAHPGPNRATGIGVFIECFDPPAWAYSKGTV